MNGFSAPIPWYRPVELLYSRVVLRSIEGPGETIFKLKKMRSHGIDQEDAEGVLEMQIFSMVSHAAFAIFSFFLLSLLGDFLGGGNLGHFVLMGGIFLGTVYLGSGASYSVDLVRVKLSPYSYIGKSEFKTIPLWAFWGIAAFTSVSIFGIIIW